MTMRLLLLGIIWALVFATHLSPDITPSPASVADRVVAGALDRIAAEPGADWQLKQWQEATWDQLRAQGAAWEAPGWFVDLMRSSPNKRKAMLDASLRLFPEP